MFVVNTKYILLYFLLAGIGDQCSNRGVKKFTEQLVQFSGAKGYCMYADELQYDITFENHVLYTFVL